MLPAPATVRLTLPGPRLCTRPSKSACMYSIVFVVMIVRTARIVIGISIVAILVVGAQIAVLVLNLPSLILSGFSSTGKDGHHV